MKEDVLKAEIRGRLKGDVTDAPSELKAHSIDASLFEVMPELVVYPESSGDVAELVSLVRARKPQYPGLSITARAAGTGMTGGSLNTSIILDVTRYMNRIISIGEEYGTAQPGVYYRDFEKATRAEGRLMPSYPASKNLCAIGGIVSNNSSGEKTLSYGSTKDYVARLKAVLSDGNEYEIAPLSKEELEQKKREDTFEGEVYRRVHALLEANKSRIEQARPCVSKNSTGYFLWDVWDGKTFDLTKLLVGSQGTLGIVTEATFRLVKPKTHTKMLVAFLDKDDFARLGDIVNTVLAHEPESFESYDDHTFRLALRYFPDMVRVMRTKAFSLALRFLPEFWMILAHGLPKLVLLAEFTGDSEEEVEEEAYAAQRDLAQFGIRTRVTTSEADEEKYWAIRRESFNLLRKHIRKKRTAPFIDDIIVRPEQLPDFLPRLNAVMNGYDITFTIAGHIGNGNFHIIPLMDFSKPESKRIFDTLSREVFDLVIAFGGSLSAEHNDGIVRTPYLRKQYGNDVYRLFGKVKDIFDPERIFNPGKKVEGTWEYALAHIDTDRT